jgi:hypothetical protein
MNTVQNSYNYDWFMIVADPNLIFKLQEYYARNLYINWLNLDSSLNLIIYVQ